MHFYYPYSFYDNLVKPDPLESIDSKKSVFVQAADIAAGIAKATYERAGLLGVVRLFEYTTYNGKRISSDDAIAIMEDNSLSRL
jgi:hypothetical protein